MEVVPHADVDGFARLARPLLAADPLRHTSTLTVLDATCRGRFTPAEMLTVHEGGAVVGALLRTEGRPALVSAVPPRCAPAVAAALPDLRGALGPVAEADAVGAALAARTGLAVHTVVRRRLFALEVLTPPDGVPGRARAVAAQDGVVDLLDTWRAEFAAEVGDGPPQDTRGQVAQALAARAGELVWEVGGAPVAQAAVHPVTAGMARIGPVYTPPEHRRHGYAGAVTAAAARWALDQGARHVLLYTDLANPTTNRLYPRLGFRPRYDAREIRLG